MSSRYWQFTVRSSVAAVPALTQFFRELGAAGVLEESAAEAGSLVSAFFERGADADRLVERVRGYLAELGASGSEVGAKVRVLEVGGDEWAESWPEYFVPIEIGRRFLIAPPWMMLPPSDRVLIVIEPGGFGTGHHPSTAGCLAMIETIVERDRPRSAIDLGTGSGLLAIAAARLGVTRVLAVDSDADAVAVAIANVARNGVVDRVRCITADARDVEIDPAPLVVANLRADVHVQLAPRYARLVAPGGVLVLGGMVEAEAGDVESHVTAEGLAVRERMTLDGWTTLVCSVARPPSSAGG